MARNFVRASSHRLTNATSPVSTTPLSMAAWFRTTDVANPQTLISVGVNGSGDNRHMMQAAGAVAGDPIQAISRTTSGAIATSSTGYSSGVWGHGCAVFTSATLRAAFFNGGGKGTNATSRAPSGMNETHLGAANAATPTDYHGGDLAECAIWNVALTDEEVLALALGVSPMMIRPQNLVRYMPIWGIHSPENSIISSHAFTLNGTPAVADHPPVARIPFFRGWSGNGVTAGGGGATVTPGVGALDVIGFAPTVQTPKTVSPGVGDVTATGFAPSVQLPVTASPGLGALTAAGFAPTVLTPRTVTTGLGEALVTGFAPTVQLPVTVSTGVGVAVFEGFAPSLGLAIDVFPGTGLLVATGFAPSVLSPVTVSTGVGALTVAGFAPSVGLPTEVFPGTGLLDATGFAPSVQLPVTVTTNTGTLDATGFAPSLLNPVTVFSATGALTATGFAPAVIITVVIDYAYFFRDESRPRFAFMDMSRPRYEFNDLSEIRIVFADRSIP